MEANPLGVDQALTLFWENFDTINEDPARAKEIRDFANILVRGVSEKRDDIDHEIEASSKNWRLSRMATVDRNILRVAVYELMYLSDVPKRVSINEAIELGKKYGSEDSGSFINGVLDKISQGVGKE